MTTRNYSSRSQQSTLTSAITAGASTMVVQSGPALLGGATIPAGTTFTLVIDPDTAIEEIVDATAVSTNTFTITRAIDGSSAQSHSAGAVTRHMAIGRDYRESNAHIEASTGVHGISNSSSVVGTIDTQTLTNKTLTSPTITSPSISGAGVDASIVFEGATPDAFETTLTVTDPTQDNTITLPNTTGTVVIANAAQTLTNKTMGDALNAGGFKITNLATPTLASDAVRKDFADAQVAAAATSAASASTSAASAATSASSALTSANSAATSAANALTSANSAATSASTMNASVVAAAASATAAATSATSAAASATAAATSATSAAASATAASTSATSASASATAAATSATSAAASATASANSASASATSATASATTAIAAATSASSALTSQTAAATSATSAAASATAAATSATSAAASATAAATSATSAAASATEAAGYVVPSQTGNAGKFLGTDGSAVSWNGAVSTDGGSTITVASGTTVPLTIQNNGTGNSFVVNDAASDSSPFAIAADGKVSIGSTANIPSTTSESLTISTDTAAGVSLLVRKSFDGVNSANIQLVKSRGTAASQTAVQQGDIVGNILFSGFDGTNYILNANILSEVDSSVSTNVVSGVLKFYTTNTSGTSGERMRITSGGLVGINVAPSGAMFTVINNTAANVGAVIRGASAQTGDFLQIQDSASTSLVKVDGNGTLIVFNGGGSQKRGLSVTSGNDGGSAGGIYILSGSAAGGDGATVEAIGRRADSNASRTFSGTIALGHLRTDAASVNGQVLGSVVFGGNASGTSASNVIYSASIYGIADGTWSSNSAMPTGLVFLTGSTGTALTTPNVNVGTERMRITAAGDVGIGTSTPTAKLDVNGSINSNNLSGVNAVLNSEFNVMQRGTSFGLTFNQLYTFDRWYGYCVPAGTFSRQATNDTTNLPNIQYCARVQRNNGNATTGSISLSQSIETVNSIPFAGKTITFSFYARRGSNFSGPSNQIIAALYAGTGTDQNFISTGFTGQSSPIYTAVSLTTTWQRFTYTATLGATVTELGVFFEQSATGTAGASDYFEVTGVQLELGSVATPYRSNQPTYAAELAACQRYYYRTNAIGTSSPFGLGHAFGTTTATAFIPYPVTMRTNPTALEQSGTAGDYKLFNSSGGDTACSAVPAQSGIGNTRSVAAVLVTVASGLTGGQVNPFAASNANAYLGWSAEL